MSTMLTISIRPLLLRLLLGLGLASGLAFLSWQIIREAIGSSVMSYVQRAANLAPEAQLEGADIAVRWAPEDPLVRYGSGSIYLAAANDQNSVQLTSALEELRAAAKISPKDYRIYLALGRAFDRNGNSHEARANFARATELAPHHFDPHWALGNHLLRTGNTNEAFAEFRAALASRPSALNLIFDYAWSAFNGDGKAIAHALEPPDAARAQFVALLILRKRTSEALEIWRANGYDRTAQPAEVRTVTETLINNGHLAEAYTVWYESKLTEHPEPDNGSLLSNGGFEQPISLNSPIPFYTWRIVSSSGLMIAFDNQVKQEGVQSFRAGFDIHDNIDLTIAAQTVPVKRATSYRLSFAARTRGLENLSNPQVEVFDAGKQERLSVSLPQFRNGETDWTNYMLEFAAGPETEAVTIRIRRPSCSDPPCPFTGRIWLDDFKLIEKN